MAMTRQPGKRGRVAGRSPAGRALLAACAAAVWLAAAAPAAICLAAPAPAAPAAPAAPPGWTTHRGNPQRTGCLDDQPGPRKPAVLWVYKTPDDFVASPVPGAGGVYLVGLGPFNTGVFYCLAPDADAAQRVLWSRGAPFIKRPIVSAPAVVESLVIFGDGMHQTDDAALICLDATSGLPLWQFLVPGRLIHIEGAPTVADGRVYVGGGEAGILCVDLKRVVLDGKEQDLAPLRELVVKRWAELLARFEEDKKAHPDTAIPPTEDALPKAAPKVHWQKGQKTWHVDAPLLVTGGRVIAASAHVDEDKIGKRCLVCLSAADGSTAWEVPLKVNPWAGATLAGNLVLVGCSNIRFDTKRIKEAQGEVVAVGLADGQVKWRKDLPGGVLSPIAVKGGLAVFTATDGKVRGWDAATGAEKWVYAGPAPFFAGPAIAADVVYAADLKGVVHALNLADGKPRWTFNVPADPAVQTPGMVYGSVLASGGEIYLATCNLEGDTADQPSVVVCLADESALAKKAPGESITVNKKQRTISIPCKIAPRKLPTFKEIYPLEVVATYPSPQGQKAHETVVTFEVRPSDVHKALESLGLKPGAPARGGEGTARGPEVRLFLEFPGITGKPRVVPLEKCMVDAQTGRPLPPLKWLFTGSVERQPDPNKPDRVYGADLAGTLVALFPVTDETVFQTNLTMREEQLLKLDTNKDILPPEGTPARLIVQAEK